MSTNLDIYPKEVSVNSIKKYISLYGDGDVCGSCVDALITDNCNKCGEGVCAKESCALTFPEKYNTSYVLCMGCINDVSKDLHLLIDMGNIEPLKEKIRNETTFHQQRRDSQESQESQELLSNIQEEEHS